MPKVRIREKFQVTIPRQAVKDFGLRVGDTYDFDVVKKTLTLSPESHVDAAILASRKDVEAGRFSGPFSSVEEGFKPVSTRKHRAHRYGS